MSLRLSKMAAAGAGLVLAAALAFGTAATAVEPKTGHKHGADGDVVRWCLANSEASLRACMNMCRAKQIDVLVFQGSRFGLPTYSPMRCDALEAAERKEG